VFFVFFVLIVSALVVVIALLRSARGAVPAERIYAGRSGAVSNKIVANRGGTGGARTVTIRCSSERATRPTRRAFVQRRRRNVARRPYRRGMQSRSSESSIAQGQEGPGLLARVGIAFMLVTAGVGLAVWIAAV
jgi:hypothetical protein